MLDWTIFNAATVAPTPTVLLADACATAWRWLHLPAESRAAAMADLVRAAPDAQTMTEALALVWRRLWREAGVDINDLPAFRAVLDDVAAGRASRAAADAALRTASIVTIKQALSERVTGAAAAQSDADLDRLNDATPALSAAVDATGLGIVSVASLEELQRAIGAFEAVRADLGTPSLRDHAWWMGLAWWAMGRGSQELARHAEARNAFECAAAHYDEAGEPGSALECRRLSNSLANRLRVDTDAASADDARALLTSQDPLTRVATLARLSGEASRAGDRVEAAALGEEAAALLVALGYADPEQDFDDAVQAWIVTAAGRLTGNALFGRLCEVTGHWAAVLGARSSDRLARDPAGSARSARALRGLATLPAEMSRQADAATRGALQRFAVWEPDIVALAPHRHDEAGEGVASELHSLDDALHALRVTGNEDASDALPDETDRQRERADALGSRVHATRAPIESRS
jgi:hypothetical protein